MADTRDVSRTHAVVDHRERDGVDGLLTMSGGKLTTLRLMAQDIVDAMCEQLGTERACRTAEERPPGNEDGEGYSLGSRLRRREATLQDEQLICECELIGRSRLESAMRRRGTANLDDIRRTMRLGMGPCQGGFCIYRATGILHGVGRLDGAEAAGVAARLPPGALEGRVADPLRRSAAPGAARRLDLPGPARRGAPTRRRRRSSEPSRRDRGRHRAGRASTAAVRLAESGRARARAGQGRGRHPPERRAPSTCWATPERVERPGEALAALIDERPEHPYALVGAGGVAAAVDWFKARIAAGPLAPYAYIGGLDENLLLPTAVGVARPSAVVPETMAGGDLAPRRRSAWSASAR